jgi:hypothetical protein
MEAGGKSNCGMGISGYGKMYHACCGGLSITQCVKVSIQIGYAKFGQAVLSRSEEVTRTALL